MWQACQAARRFGDSVDVDFYSSISVVMSTQFGSSQSQGSSPRSPQASASQPQHSRLKQTFRQLSAPLRLLPDFVILGTQKGGTTSLFAFLLRHPQVLPVLEKEINFFDLHYNRGVLWYRSRFSLRLKKDIGWLRGQPLHAGEATPYYLFHPQVPQRMRQTLPRAKLIVLLRNPVDRAYSHYQHNVRRGRESLSFEEAIAQEPQRLAGEGDRLRSEPRYTSFNHRHYSYLSRGLYIDQIRAYEREFPTQQLLILNSDDLFQQPEATFAQVLEFLELSSWTPKAFKAFNTFPHAANIQPDTRQALVDYFAPHNAALYQHLNRDFGW